MRRLALIGAMFVTLGFSAPASAADISSEVQVQLQSAMQHHIDQISVDGAYTYIDAETSELKTTYPANVHPMILEFGSDYFVCSEFVDEDGTHFTADFLVRRVGDDYRVVQTIIDNRPMVQRAMSRIRQ